MKYNFNKISFHSFFKFMLLIFIGYFLYLLTVITMQVKNNSEIGRYRFDTDTHFLIDTKTGKIVRVKNIQ